MAKRKTAAVSKPVNQTGTAGDAKRTDASELSRDELLQRAQAWSEILLAGSVHYFPVRHHSPACSTHLTRWIRKHKPESIIIEGPPSMNQWISSLLDADCQGPVAVLQAYREAECVDARRHSAFYPLCDYSPEWVALREGQKLSSRMRFADLEFADKVRVRHVGLEPEEKPEQLLGVLLNDESHLQYSQFINSLVRRMGCRDFNELWDHLFESRSEAKTTEQFVGELATYCDLSRASHAPEQLELDGTLAREAEMVEVIRKEKRRLRDPRRSGSLLVVTGGFHTVALPNAVVGRSNPHQAKLPELADALTGSWLIRYSFDQLDALNGYQSGMPHPGFYEALWQARESGTYRNAVAALISTVARKTRGQPIPYEASVTDSISALSMLDQLRELRGHLTPTRHDLLDAIESSMRKENAASQDMLSHIINTVLTGDRVGCVPKSAGQPPIIAEFLRLAKAFRLPADTISGRVVTLELYRKPAHRETSFFFHQLQLLEVPYAKFVDGPDFAAGYHLKRLAEQWQVAWSPTTEARLAELASLGDSVAVAAAHRTEELLRSLNEDSAARDAQTVVDLLIRTCQCGLHQFAPKMLALVREQLNEDPSFASVSGALSRLALLRSAREPLEVRRLDEIKQVIQECFHRAVHLVSSLASVPDDQLHGSLDGLLSVREFLSDVDPALVETDETRTDDPAAEVEALALDASMFWEALHELIQHEGDPVRAEIAGAAAGILHALGKISEEQLCRVVENYLDAAVEDVGAACGVVQGLMIVARETFWRLDSLLKRIDRLFQEWEEERFHSALPHLRLAFSHLGPKEVDMVAERVAGLHEVDELGPLVHPDVTEDDMKVAQQANLLMQRSLAEDGLS